MIARITKIDYEGSTVPPLKDLEIFYMSPIGWGRKEQIVAFIKLCHGKTATVYIGNTDIEAEVVDAHTPYIRSKGNTAQTDGILNLPKESSGLI